MTKAELKKSHDAMARFIVELCRYSDRMYGDSHRGTKTKQHYARAMRLLNCAGIKYESHSKGMSKT